MAKCKFCQRRFQSEQGVKAHLKHCKRYQTIQRKKTPALGTKPEATATPAATPLVQPSPPVAAQDLTAPLLDFVKAMSEAATKRDAPQTSQQQRRKILEATKAQVIDRTWTPLGQVTASMRGGAKLAIERELASPPLEELPFDEVCEFAAAIRDCSYAPAFNKQTRETARQDAENKARHRKEIEEMAASHRADRRKTTLIEQAIGQARARCEAKQVVSWERLKVLVDIESQLKEFLTGSESVLDAHAIIQTVLDASFVQAAARQDAARAKANERWYEELAGVLVLGALLAAPLLALRYPAQALAILSWIQRTFGLTPGAEVDAPTHNAAETTPPAASAEARPRSKRWRKDPVAPSSPEPPWGNAVGPEPGHA
jgi:hypothetical protein